MKDLVRRFCKPGDSVMDTCLGVCFSAKVFSLVDQRRKFVK